MARFSTQITEPLHQGLLFVIGLLAAQSFFGSETLLATGQLLADQGEGEHDGPVVTTFWGAMKTIIVADALMGVDNVLGVAGAAHGSFDLVIIGLLLSVPIVVFGSTLVLGLVERFPIIIQAGSAVLAFTAAKMITSEPLLGQVFGHASQVLSDGQTAARWSLYALAVVGVLLAGRWNQRQPTASQG